MVPGGASSRSREIVSFDIDPVLPPLICRSNRLYAPHTLHRPPKHGQLVPEHRILHLQRGDRRFPAKTRSNLRSAKNARNKRLSRSYGSLGPAVRIRVSRLTGLGACSTPAVNTPGSPPERRPAKLLRSAPGPTTCLVGRGADLDRAERDHATTGDQVEKARVFHPVEDRPHKPAPRGQPAPSSCPP